jgi:hypothetical protein
MSASSPAGESTAQQPDIPGDEPSVDRPPVPVSVASASLPAVSGLVFLGVEDAQACADGTCL